jgi:uncharacterized protein (TIGR02246 family)
MRRPILLALALVLALGACAPEAVDLHAEQAAVKSVVDEFPDVLDTKDLDLFSRIMAHDADMVAFGTDASERWVGYDAIRDAVQAQLAAFDSVSVVTSEQVIHVHPTGLAAWFSEVMDWHITQGENEVDLQGARMTGVLEKRDGNWLFVQFHVSMPVEGQAVAY